MKSDTPRPSGTHREQGVFTMEILRSRCLILGLATLVAAASGCSDKADTTSTGSGSGDGATAGQSGNDPDVILIDGSSTVWPVSMVMAEAFEGGTVEVAAPSGTSGGFKKFLVGETDINDASRKIKDSELEACRQKGIEPLELSVAIDGISVVVNKENDWCDALTFAQLRELWAPGSKIRTWKDLDAAWPDKPIELFGPDADSGTFDYFTEVVVETTRQCRDDYEPATDDNVLVKGVTGNKYALGYFGYAYYSRNRRELKAVAIAGGAGATPVAPTARSIASYEYPISRPVFIYVNQNRLTDKGMPEFLKFYLGDGQKLVPKAGLISLTPEALKPSLDALNAALQDVR